ncbi:MAG: phage tail spike protein [Subdoligranulum sp.]|jgi:phage minor structural protein
MTPRYYAADSEIKGNGVGALRDALYCTVTEERNGSYELEMGYPVSGQHYSELTLRGLICAKPNPYSEEQYFRVYKISRPINGQVIISAQHISYDLCGIPVAPYTAGTAAQALDRLKSQATVECPFEFWTDLSTTADFAAPVPSSLRSLLGGIDGSILDVYGGEYEWDNYTVKLHSERGTDRGVSIRYGKNLTDLTQEENCTNVYTGVYPYWADSAGAVTQISTGPVVDVPENQYSFTRVLLLDLSQDYTERPTDEQLKQSALSYIKANKIGVPKVSLKLSYAQLEQTVEYKGKALLERVGLCDTVHVTFERLGVDATAKVIKTTYNVLLDRYDSVELGTPRSNLASTIVGIEKSTKTEVDKTKSALQQAVDQATKLITGNLGGYVVLHSSAGNDTPDELLVMDQPDINTATKVWRWNLSGWGYSSTGYAGPYRLAATMDGAINADFLTTGTLNAEIIKAGILKSQTGDAFYLDLVSGELRINAKSIEINSETIYDGKTVDAKINESAKQIKSEMTQSTKITGGGNLILGSESFRNATYVGIDSSVVYGDDGSATITNANTCRGFKFNAVSAHITKGVTLCLSVMYKLISGTDALRLGITFTSDDGQNYIAYIKTADQLEIEQTDGWVLRYGTWTPSKNGVLKTVEFDSNGNCTNKFELLHPMLQYGNAPTAWNASSGDYLTQESAKSLFSQTADEIKTEVTKSVTETVTANVKDTAISAANDAVDSKLQDYATTATVNSLKEDVSSISQKADSISTKVSSLEKTTTTISNDLDSTKQEFKTVKESVSAIDQKADSITQTVTQRITGGNNIIVGTDDWNNATLDAGGNDLRKKGTYTISGESVRVTNRAQNTRFHFGADKTLVIAKGMTYCASVLYKLNSGTDSLFLQFETKNSSGAKSYYDKAFKNAKQDIELDNGWKLRWAAFTATADGYADGLFVSTANDFATVTNDLTIMHPMVQMGNAPTAWTASTGDYLTANETKTEIKQTVSEIKLTASTSGTSSTIKLTAGGTEITSAQINLSGVVTFSDLSTWNQDKTIINGGNITTGQLHNLNYTTVYDLDNAWIRMGTEAGERVFLDNRHIAWYATINTGSIGLTGVLYSEAGSSYIGACSKYAKYGWVNGLDPTSYVGMQITYNRSDDSDADFNTTRVGVSGKLNVHNLDVWGEKSRVVPTSFGALKMAAFETPTPTFADWGRGQCGPEGWCLIALDPRYAETIAQYGQPAWLLTDLDGTGHLWAEDCGQYAIVHGAAGQRFAWLCMAAQRGYEGSYADRSDSSYPAGDPAGIELAASTAARAQEASTDAAADLLTMDTGAKQAVDTLLDDLEGSEI